MDLQVILIGAVVFIVSAVLIYLISAMAMREKTFDEVIAEQKRQDEKEKAKAKTDKKHDKEGKKKGKKKEKLKEKTPALEVEFKEHKMVNLEIDPEIIEPNDDIPQEIKPKSKSKKAPKSILVNKDEKVLLDVSKTLKETKHEIHPKDELELKHKYDKEGHQEKLHHKALKKMESVPEKEISSPVKVQEEMMHTEIKMQTAAPPSHTHDKRSLKSKMHTVVSNDAPVNGSFLISSVKTASLSETDAQLLIDFLVNKYGGPSLSGQDWNKKSKGGDPVSLLRKQLEEKERSLQEEQQLAMSANNKWKELKQELTQQKANHTAIEKQLAEKMTGLAQEKHALQTRMQQTHEQHMIEMEHMQTKMQQLEAIADKTRMQRLTEENKLLKEKLAQKQSEPQVDVSGMRQTMSILENELSSNVIKLNAAENSKKSLEDKVSKYEDQVKKLEEGQKDFDMVLNKRLEEMSKALRQEEAKNASLSNDLHKANGSTKTVSKECNDLKHKLEDLQKANDVLKAAENECNTLKSRLSELESTLSASDHTKDLEERLKDTEKRKCEVESKLQDLTIKLEDSDRKRSDLEGNIKNLENKLDDVDKERSYLKTESDKLASESSNFQDRLKDSDRHKSDLERNIKNLENVTRDFDQQRQKFEADLEQLRKENQQLSAELTMEREKPVEITLETSKPLGASAPNGDIQQEAGDSLIKISVAEHEKILSDKEKEITKLVTELDSRKKDSLDVEEQLESQKKKNNELREKNWKAMEALEKSEKSVSEKIQVAIKSAVDEYKAECSETEKYDKEIVQRIFPCISLKESGIDTEVSPEHDAKDLSTKSNEAHREWMSRFENEAIVYLNSLSSKASSSGDMEHLQKENEEREAKVKFLEDSNNKLQSQIQEYRSVLSQTENKLQQLENSVELEERKWQERLQNTQSELEQAKNEIYNLSEDMQKFRGSQEMDDKMKRLESDLQVSEERYHSIERQAKEAEGKIAILEVQLKENKTSGVNIDDVNKDLEDLRKLLEEERKKNKNLAMNQVKLNGIIKTGQDALNQEQETVRKLQEQVQDRNKDHGSEAFGVGEAATGTGDAGATTTL